MFCLLLLVLLLPLVLSLWIRIRMDQQELFTNSIPDPGQRWVASSFYIPREHYTEALSRIRIRKDPYNFPGSGSGISSQVSRIWIHKLL
jgi:hypothetical protein